MKRVNNKKNLYKSIILLVIVVIGIGYAYLTSNLSITGATEVVANTWDIHFENLSVTTGSVTASTPAEIDSNETSIEYAITLSRPKDFYEFTVDVKNDGTLPGKVSISELSGLDTNSSKVIDYTITYTNGNPVNIGDILNASAKKTIKVKVFYKDNISSTDLPSSNLHLDLTYTLQFLQSDKEEVTTSSIVQELKTNNSSCFTKYEGNVTDRVGVTEEATNVYFDKCADKRNIIFGGYCWQVIRTTQTGGIKMIYNGEPDGSGQCGSSRDDHKGIVGANSSTQNLDTEYLYGATFTYNTTTSEFTLVDTESSTWSDSTYQNILGKFTCKNTNGQCTTLYNINGYSDSTTAYTSSYTIGNTNFAQIGNSSYNANHRSPAMVGYKYNKVYNWVESAPTSGSLMGNDVSYSNGTYTLLPASGESTLGTTLDATHHYTCNSTSSTCSKVRYYYYSGEYGNYYIELDGAENIDVAVNEMLFNDDVNTYNSSIKGIIDSWYVQYLSSKTNMLEDTIYCSSRSISNLSTNGWNKDGSLNTYIFFKNHTLNGDLSCINETDQFAIANNKAKLTYPVSLATFEELYTLTNNNSSTYYSTLTNTGNYWYAISALYYNMNGAFVRGVLGGGSVNNGSIVSNPFGVRPVISLAQGNTITSGTGSETDPWVID